MKTLLIKYPIGSRMVLAILLFVLALLLSTFLNKGLVKAYFPYSAAIFLGVSTWILYKTENKSLSEIGLNLKMRNLWFLPLGVLIGALAFLVAKYARAIYTGESLMISDAIEYESILYAFYFILPTVVVEEFLFRGYLFKKTISKTNVIVANIIFSILFMSIHVLDEDVLQNKGMMILLIVSIPVGHLWFATAMLKSKTLFFPIGLHLGNNWATRHLISNSNSGDSFLYTINTATFETWPSFIGFLFIYNGVFLVVTFLIWKWNDFSIFKIKRN
ncbi:CPBP family intramembrane glutamic endopeptidase [Psychroserpens algicola]|uniref:CPBP family intramembrane metalloprotease n=1 Tax=Psychroserpens algicola TaxID=1719034 RepID=A0ABT0H6G7_9FLAO|nr:CPBP family intramembrane glutamic endopeptidase [Psychroserpens algicola]MCK8479955.1 CPBP family intramembrane metalloprotease [Psychroserpens algicola]